MHHTRQAPTALRLLPALLQYCYTEEDLKAATAQLAPGSYHVQRFKVKLLDTATRVEAV